MGGTGVSRLTLCSWTCAELSGFKALAVKHKLQPQQGKINSKLSLIRDAPLWVLINQQELSCLAHPTVTINNLDMP